jgi:hypothetical protein
MSGKFLLFRPVDAPSLSLLMSMIAFLLAWGLTDLLLPAFGAMTARHCYPACLM